MRNTHEQARQIVAGLSTDDKIRLLSGRDFWTTEDAPGAPGVMVTDGPHGLRKQFDGTDHVGLSASVPATCFPTAVALGATWDVTLLEEVGEALGRECRAENVAVLLGPGLNIKRHPAGGRNFEYFSEDPLVSGSMAAALVRGIQSQGVGACLKHYAVNNHEANRMRVDAVVDERTLREMYLTGFEIAIRESQPWTVMSSYNLVNGTHVGEHRELLTTILREEWGWDGLVMSDWGATYDRAEGVHAGMDLEMPGSLGAWDRDVREALDSGRLSHEDLDRAATRVVELSLRAAEGAATPVPPLDLDAHHRLARRAAAAGMVLLTNDGILPLSGSGQKIAVIGAFAETPRFQGAGSSQVRPTRIDTLLDAVRDVWGDQVVYAPGYDVRTGETTHALLDEARAAAADADVVVLMVGLPGIYESEGYDRSHLDLPEGHHRLAEAVFDANDRTVVVLANGSPVILPWADRPAAILEAYLGGQAGGSAIADVLTGVAEPGGRLAESFPASAEDLPSHANFPGSPTQVEYREGLFIGYRFHDKGTPARFPFGHGLSYTTFEYTDITASQAADGFSVSVTVTNTGQRAGADVVQVYIRDVESSVPRPEKELRAFAKVHLEPGASETVTLPLDRRAFAVWDVATHRWAVEAGEFDIIVGASSTDLRGKVTVTMRSTDVVTPVPAPAGFVADDAEFATMLGRPVPTPRGLLPYTVDSTIGDLNQTFLGRRLASIVHKIATKAFPAEGEDREFFEAIFKEMPLRGLSMMSQGQFDMTKVRRVVSMLNAGSPAALRARRR